MDRVEHQPAPPREVPVDARGHVRLPAGVTRVAGRPRLGGVHGLAEVDGAVPQRELHRARAPVGGGVHDGGRGPGALPHVVAAGAARHVTDLGIPSAGRVGASVRAAEPPAHHLGLRPQGAVEPGRLETAVDQLLQPPVGPEAPQGGDVRDVELGAVAPPRLADGPAGAVRPAAQVDGARPRQDGGEGRAAGDADRLPAGARRAAGVAREVHRRLDEMIAAVEPYLGVGHPRAQRPVGERVDGQRALDEGDVVRRGALLERHGDLHSADAEPDPVRRRVEDGGVLDRDRAGGTAAVGVGVDDEEPGEAPRRAFHAETGAAEQGSRLEGASAGPGVLAPTVDGRVPVEPAVEREGPRSRVFGLREGRPGERPAEDERQRGAHR